MSFGTGRRRRAARDARGIPASVRRVGAAVAALALAVAAVAAEGPGLVHRRWGAEDGLPQGSVNDLARDANGYLWLATFGGLARFDGVRFVRVRLEGEGWSAGLRVRQVERAGRGVVAVTALGHVVRVERGTVRLLGRVERPHTLAGDGSETLWLAAGDGLYRVTRHGVEPVRLPPEPRTGDIRALLPVGGGRVLVGTAAGLFRFAGGTLERVPGVGGGPVASLAVDGAGRLVVVRTGDVLRLGPSGVERFLTGTTPRAAVVLADGTVVAGTAADGLWLLGERGAERIGVFPVVPGDPVTSMLDGGESGLWVGTTRTGLHQLVPGVARRYGGDGGALDHSVFSVAWDRGGVWANLGCEGLARVDAEGERIHRLTAPDGRELCLAGLLPEPDGSLLVGTWSHGLYRFRDGTLRPVWSGPGAPWVVRTLIRSGDGGLLLGTSDGLLRLEGGEVARLPLRAEVYVLARARDGSILAGTAAGVLRLAADGSPEREVAGRERLGGSPVRALLENPDGSLWVGTYGAGLFFVRDAVVTPVSAAAGLEDLTVSAIVRDGRGFLRLTGNLGVVRVEEAALRRGALGGGEAPPQERLTAEDGLPATECNGGHREAAVLAPDGTLWVATMRGLAAVDTTRPLWAGRAPPILERIVVDGREVPADRRVVLNPDFRSLEIEFTAIWLRNPRALRFRYRIGGPGTGWNTLGGQRRLVVHGLPPGTHRLDLECRVGGGPWVAAAGLPIIERRPRWTESRWLPATAAASGALLVLVVSLARLRQRRRREALLEEEVRRRTRERDRLMELVAAVNQRAALPEILDTLFERLGELVPIDRLAYATLREDGVVEATWARTASGRARLVEGTTAPLGETSLRELAETGAVRTIGDLEGYLREHPGSETTRLLVEEGMRSSLAVPLSAFGKPVGFLFLDSTTTGAYGAEAEALLRAVAAQISVILEKGRLMAGLEEANREFRRQAETDELTGLANRRRFERHARLEWRRHARSGEPLAVVMVDVDRFKAYNDAKGHGAGDACLARVAEVLAAAARRPGDLAARWGGEEFVVLFSGVGAGRALALAEALRREVESMALPHPDTPWGVVTISAGVASVVPPGDGGLEGLLAAADRALYRAKAGGRNRVQAARPGEVLDGTA